MKRVICLTLILIAGAGVSGCSFLGGAGTGVAATGAGYELNARQQMEKIKGQYERGEIDKREYEIRKDQIQQGSLAY